eukprot:13321528-Alexandrium_andersonii.AAC.1
MSSRSCCPSDFAPRPSEDSDPCGADGSSTPRKSEMSQIPVSPSAMVLPGSTCKEASSARSYTAVPRSS